MFSLMNNLEMNRAKEKLKKPHFRGGIPCSFRDLCTMCTNIISIFKFVKILNHSQVQVRSNKKKPQLFESSVG